MTVSDACSSLVFSDLISDLGSDARDPEPESVTEVRPTGAATGEPPPWWGGACDATAMVLGGDVDARPALWVRYLASRSRKVWSMNHTDAVGWLTDVVGRERREARDRRDRDEGFKAERASLLPKSPKAQNSTKLLRERDDWAQTAGPPDPETAAQMRKLLGGFGR